MAEFIEVKGWKAIGNKLDARNKVTAVKEIVQVQEGLFGEETSEKESFQTGDVVELKIGDAGQIEFLD